MQADTLDDAGRRADRSTRVKSTVEELRQMRAMLSEQQAEMRAMKLDYQTELRKMKKEYQSEIGTMKQELAEMRTAKQDNQNEIAALRQELLEVKAATQEEGNVQNDAPQQLQASARVTSHMCGCAFAGRAWRTTPSPTASSRWCC